MAIEKALYQAPQGLSEIDNELEPDLEITIEDPESVEIGIDGEPILRINDEEEEDDFGANLAEEMGASELQSYVDGLELLGMKLEERSEPWEGACGVYHPLLSEALVKFQSETMMETFPAAGPVKTEIIGKETSEKKASAARVQEDMNYQLTDAMPEYRPEHERMLWGLGLSGNAFKKVYYDPNLGRQAAIFVPAEDIVVPYGASNLESAERVTHVMRKTENEVRKLQVAGFYSDIDLGDPVNSLDEVEKKIAERMGFRATTDDRYKILEMHVDLDLEGFEDKDEDGEPTGIALPYVVTIEKGTNNVLAIRRNWEPDDKTYAKRNHFVHYPYIPGFGFYAFGLIHLIGAFAKSGTSILRQLVDAGTLSNLPGGFKTRGLRVKGDDTPIAPGEFRDVDVPSGTMRDNLMPLPYKEPSQVLLALMNQIIDEGRRFAAAADMKVSEMNSQAPVGTTLAILERTLKVMSAVQARIHYAMKQEFRLLKVIIADYTPEEYDYEPEEGSRKAKKSDYDQVNVIPVSDPNAATMSQKVMQYQAALQLAQTAPQLYNLPVLHRQMLDVLGIKNYQKLVPIEEDKKPQDPVSENQDILMMKPVKAFLYQDHQAHIQVHMAAMQDPKIMALVGKNPQAPAMQAAMMAHINEHIAYEYRKQMEMRMGIQLPAPDKDDQTGIPEEMEVQISQMAAQAAGQMLQQNQQEAQAQQNQQAQQDPLVQMQQKELQLKEQDMELRKQKMLLDAATNEDKLEIERERIASQEKIAGMQVGVKAARDRAELESKEKIDGLRIGSEIAKTQAQMNVAKATPQKGNNGQNARNTTERM